MQPLATFLSIAYATVMANIFETGTTILPPLPSILSSPWDTSLLPLLTVSFYAFLLLMELVAWATAAEEGIEMSSRPVVSYVQ